jgi:cytosine/adenosine deaminase-related metal-dependent hydrolase
MFATMRSAHVTQRGLDGSLNARDVLEFAPVDGAAACGLAARAGRLAPVKDAGVILLSGDDPSVSPSNNRPARSTPPAIRASSTQFWSPVAWSSVAVDSSMSTCLR